MTMFLPNGRYLKLLVSHRDKNVVKSYGCLSRRYVFTSFHVNVLEYLTKWLNKFSTGSNQDLASTKQVKRSPVRNLVKAIWKSNDDYYAMLNEIDMEKVDTCSRHLYPGYFVGFTLGGKIMFHDNHHTGERWISGGGRILRYCQDPDPPFMATEKEVNYRYKPKRIKALDFSGTYINAKGLLSIEGMLDDIEIARFNNCTLFDDQCLSLIKQVFGPTLRELDISYCTKVTTDGLWAIKDLHHVKVLKMYGMPHLAASKELFQVDQTVPFLKIYV